LHADHASGGHRAVSGLRGQQLATGKYGQQGEHQDGTSSEHVAGLQTSAATLLSLLAHHKRRLAWAQSVSGV
jgi:hypothetical protein